ncbi:MAG: radical SAM protein [Candidatus Eremiobacteraeota bacterium]|nr:radical SAM protein [Candidatus Eremiobacteraeota bacterium]
MRLLMVVPNYELEPFGIAIISAVLKRAGYQVDILNKQDTPLLPLVLAEKKHEFVATGGMSCNYHLIEEIVSQAHEGGAKVILGGGIVTSEPELISRVLQIDYSVIGEGEETILELLATLEKGGDLQAVAGIGFFSGDQFILTKRRPPINDLDSLPFPDWDSLDFERHLEAAKPSDQYYFDFSDHPRIYHLLASRSCPFQCTFCYHPLGNKYRQRSIGALFDELRQMVPKFRINNVAISDELFSQNRERVFEFCTRFSELRKEIPWELRWGCQLRVDKLDEELLDTMKASGCTGIAYGFESYSPLVLKSMKKHITPEQIDRAVHLSLERNMAIQANFIFGDPAETWETFHETMSFWKEHSFAGIQLGYVMPCPDSELYRYCLQRGIIRDRLDYIEHHIFDKFNMTALSDAEFEKLDVVMKKIFLSHYYHAIPLSVGPDHMTVRCPHCRKLNEYRNYDVTKKNFIVLSIVPVSLLYFSKMVYCRKCNYRFYAVSSLYKLVSFLYLFFASHGLIEAGRKIRRHLRNIFHHEKRPGKRSFREGKP